MRGEKKKRFYNTNDRGSLPLSAQRESQKDITSVDLYDFSVERCEFCDAVFYNKFNIMVHTASHIIIPLLRQKLHQCTKCNNYYPSPKSLEFHTLNDHLNITNKSDYKPELLKSFVRKEPYTVLLKEEFTLHNNTERVNQDLLNSFVNKQPVMLLTKEPLRSKTETTKEPLLSKKETDSGNSVLQSFVQKKAVTLLEPLVVNNDTVIDLSDDESSLASANSKCSNVTVLKIKDRILFEDEDNELNDLNMGLARDRVIRSPELLNDLTTDWTVRIKPMNIGSNEKGFRGNAIILGKYPCDNVGSNSVHYDDLMMSGPFGCKKCGKLFPNRYKFILHETSHIRIKRRLPMLCRMCDWYIATNHWDLQKHQNSKHPDKTAKVTETSVCKQCNLKYVYYYKHMRNYHNVYVCTAFDCTRKFANKLDYFDHRSVHRRTVHDVDNGDVNSAWNSKLVKVCQVCYSFLKNTAQYHYRFVRSLCEVGKRYNCERCETLCFELSLVKLDVRKRKVREECLARKNLSNQDRLKKMQKRFKNMKILNKC